MPGSTESSISSLGDCEVKYHINVFFKWSLIIILEIEIKSWYQVDQVEEEEVTALKRKVAELEIALAQNHRGGREVNLSIIYILSMNEWMNKNV